MTSTELSLNGLTYAVDEVGEGPPLLLLHGFTGSQASWDPVMSSLSGSFRVLRVDLPGHGASAVPAEPARIRLNQVAADLARLLTCTAATPVNLVGYSMGGRLALYLALHYPQLVATLVLESASPGLPTAAERRARQAADERLATALENQGVPAFVATWEKLPLFRSHAQLKPAVREHVRQIRLHQNAAGLAASLRGMGTGVQPSLWPLLQRWVGPTLILCGLQDAKFAAIGRRMVAHWPQAELRLIPDAGHTVHLEQPIAWSEAVTAFLHRTGTSQNEADLL